MLQNYLITAFRNMLRSPLFSTINLLGMVLGITCSSLILLYAWDELHYDQFHANAKNVYRITTQQEKATTVGVVTPGPLAPELRSNFPEIVNTARVGKWSGVFKTKDVLFAENEIYFADNSLLHIFDFPLVKGDVETVLTQPNHLVLNERMAKKYFGAEWKTRADVLGTYFRLNNETDFVVAGVIQNAPASSSFQFDFLLSFDHLLGDRWSYNWGSYNFITYVQLRPDHQIEAFTTKIKNTLRNHDKQAGFNLGTQPLSEIYLHPLDYDLWTKKGNLLFIKIFVIIGLGILLIACFNFINLSTAQSTNRSKEVGIRKTIGASRAQIFVQFLGESLIIVGCAAILSRGLIDLVLPYFNILSGKELTLHPLNKIFFALLLVFTLIIGFLASLYPASLLSSFRPIKTLRGILPKRAGSRFREVLVVAQFSIAIILMIGTAVIYEQLLFIQQKDLGFEKEQLMYVGLGGNLRENEEVFREELRRQHEVIGASAATSILVNNNNYSNIEWEGQLKGQELTITQMNADPYFIPLMNIKMAHGRNFSIEVPGDSSTYIINETAAKNMGFTGDDALGKEVGFWGMKGKIIGVVRDFHFRPMNVPIEPFIMRYQAKTFYWDMLVKIKPNQVANFIEKLPALYQRFDKENPLNYGFVDEQLNKQYKSEQLAGNILAHFTGLSIFITCLGLLGLAAFAAEQRTKEIGIRKVMGASVTGIVQLLSKDFMRLMLLAILIGAPLAWYAMSQWLEGFAYRTEIHWWIFLVTGCLAVIIALVTVSSQAIKAAVSNPVESLRSE